MAKQLVGEGVHRLDVDVFLDPAPTNGTTATVPVQNSPSVLQEWAIIQVLGTSSSGLLDEHPWGSMLECVS